jgi:hypothetical protein
MISRKENIRSPFAEQLPQRERGSRSVSRPGVRPILGMGRDGGREPFARHRRQERLDPRALVRALGHVMRPSAKRAARPKPSITGRGTPQTGISAPIRAMRGSGASVEMAAHPFGPVAQKRQSLVLRRPDRQAHRHAPVAARHPEREPLGPAGAAQHHLDRRVAGKDMGRCSGSWGHALPPSSRPARRLRARWVRVARERL